MKSLHKARWLRDRDPAISLVIVSGFSCGSDANNQARKPAYGLAGKRVRELVMTALCRILLAAYKHKTKERLREPVELARLKKGRRRLFERRAFIANWRPKQLVIA